MASGSGSVVDESNKGMKMKSNSMELKLNALKRGEETSNRLVNNFFKLEPKRVREWRLKKKPS